MGFLIVGLAAWRLASLLVHESGPFNLFLHLRTRAGVPEYGEIVGFLPKVLTCMWCCGIYTSVFAYLIYTIWAAPIIILAGAAVVVLVEEVIRGERS